MITDYHAKYFAFELSKRSSSDSLQKLTFSLLDAQVDLNPHQVEAALFAFSSPLSRGAVLADEVGLGKTIEAGLVISQKWAEKKRKILIIVPSNLRKQWYQELSDKFFLPSIILETPSFNQAIRDGKINPFDHAEIVICSYHFAKAKSAYIRYINWDLVVIDEAHRLRNVYKPSNKIANAIKGAVAHAPKILLTATPLQNSLLELYGLVSVIDDYTFGDLKSFKARFSRLAGDDAFDDLKERLKPICKRTLRRQVLEYIKYTNRTAITQEFIPSPDEQKLYDLVSSYLQRGNLYALPPSQRQLMTLILRRLLASSTFAISGTLEALAKKLEDIIQKQNNQGQEDYEDKILYDFETYNEVKDEWQENDNEEYPPLTTAANNDNPRQYSLEEIEEIKKEIADLKEFQRLAQSITRNSKGDVLLTALKKGFAETERFGGRKKAIIFTESTRTQKYLRNILENTEYQGKIVLFNGSNTDPRAHEIYQRWIDRNKGTDRLTGSRAADMRAAIVDYFRDEAVIMIATEAAAEGINLQFCSLVVNYDLPWNPQRIEQRIGRCHRYGQEFDVVVVNFLNKNNEADQRVYRLLDEKFKLFSGVFGASDEVLGSIESGVDFEKRIAQIYQSCRTPQEIQDSFDQLQRDLEEQIEDRMKTARQKLLENFDEEVNEKLRVNLQESKAYLSRYEDWLWQITRFFLEPYACFDSVDHSFTLNQNPFPNENIYPGLYKLGKNPVDANTYRIGHPLARCTIEQCKSLPLPEAEIAFNYSEAPQKISILEPLIGKSGWLSVSNLTITSFETEDHVILAGMCDDGALLEEDQCQRLFSLPATVLQRQFISRQGMKGIGGIEGEGGEGMEGVQERLNQITHEWQTQILQMNAERNAAFFDAEMEKMDKWAEDLKNSLEIELKNLDRDIAFRKAEAKKILKLEEKVEAHRHIKEMEKKRNTMRFNLYQAQDDVDIRKEKLIEEIEARLNQRIERDELFFIRWKLV
jgi:ERCC4-related helicase